MAWLNCPPQKLFNTILLIISGWTYEGNIPQTIMPCVWPHSPQGTSIKRGPVADRKLWKESQDVSRSCYVGVAWNNQLIVGGAVASGLVSSTLDQAVQVHALARDIVLCSWARHLTLTAPLSTQVYKWVPANLMLGVTLQWTSNPSWGE